MQHRSTLALAMIAVSLLLVGAGCDQQQIKDIINEYEATQKNTEQTDTSTVTTVDEMDVTTETSVENKNANKKTSTETNTQETPSKNTTTDSSTDTTSAPTWSDSDIAITWPQSFNALEVGSSVNIAWDIKNPSLLKKTGHLLLYREDGTFAQTVAFISRIDTLHYTWNVSLSEKNLPGKYKIELAIPDGPKTMSEIFSIAGQKPTWTSADAAVTWPQSFNALIVGNTVNIGWKINHPALGQLPMHITLLHEDGSFAQTIGFVSRADVKHYAWTVVLEGENTPGKYKVQLATEDGFSTIGETFTIANP